MSAALGGALYGALGWIQELVGLTVGMAIDFALALPSAAITLVALRRRQEVGR
ncbi:hypothetical protein [Nonomuraea sp. NPDC049129]|uniref:hypothetical protein n=1 Tax=unclassified Nonomuraea TaxID=2593643 RepID=UPI003401C21B